MISTPIVQTIELPSGVPGVLQHKRNPNGTIEVMYRYGKLNAHGEPESFIYTCFEETDFPEGLAVIKVGPGFLEIKSPE